MLDLKLTNFITLGATVAITIVLVSSAGCEKPPEIAEYRIPKSQSGLEGLRESTKPIAPPATAAKVEKQMVVAIFEETDATWFFKINGPKEQVESSKAKWQPVIDSVEFVDGEPKWKADGWQELGPKPFRHNTLVVPETNPPLELAISNLGPNQDLLLNVNRWRGQLELPKASKEELDTLLVDKKTETSNYILFEAVGMGAGQMRPPFAGGASTPPFANGTPTADTTKVETQMVVAIFEETDATWFFKINGPKKSVDATKEKWQPVIDSVKFVEGEPNWSADGWKELGPKPFRHQTLIVPDTSPPLELAISSLGPNQDLLLNVNRWRGQLGLPKTSKDELDSMLENKKTEAGEYTLFQATGQGSGQMRPPFASGSPPTSIPPAAPIQSSKIKFEVPDGWSEGRVSSMVLARLSRKSADSQVQITVVEMPADANEWEPNVKRWAGQVGMKLDDEQLKSRTKKLTIDSVEGQIVDLSSDSESENGVIAGMVKRQGSAWFLKLSGNRKLVDKSKKEFESFLDSLKFN